MLKKMVLAIAFFIAGAGFAFAQVDVNKSDQAALDGVKGIGPKLSRTILDERKKSGPFKDWPDFQKRVKGIGEKNSINLSHAGLTVNGQAKAGAPADAKSSNSLQPAPVGGNDSILKTPADSGKVPAGSGAKTKASAS